MFGGFDITLQETEKVVLFWFCLGKYIGYLFEANRTTLNHCYN